MDLVEKFNTKSEALKFIETISFRNYYQKVEIIYRNKKWHVYYKEF